MISSKIRIIILSVIVVILMLIGLRFLINAKSFQFFGKIYPRIATSKKVVALTFDDGPSKKVDTILSILETHNVNATFFLTGDSIEQHLSETNKIVMAGHEIGNHSYSHDRLILKSYDTIKEEIEKTDALIRQTGFRQDIHFRPPYGKKLFVLPYYLKQHNRKTIMWDIAPEVIPEIANDPEKLAAYVIEHSKNGSIILMHLMSEDRQASLKSLHQLIPGLKSKGFEFKTISEILKYENS